MAVNGINPTIATTGTIVAQGTPEQVAKAGKGHAARFLKEELKTGKYAAAS